MFDLFGDHFEFAGRIEWDLNFLRKNLAERKGGDNENEESSFHSTNIRYFPTILTADAIAKYSPLIIGSEL